MAGYIRGITIQIDGETKGMDAALKKVNSTTRSLQGELKRVENFLKMNPEMPTSSARSRSFLKAPFPKRRQIQALPLGCIKIA